MSFTALICSEFNCHTVVRVVVKCPLCGLKLKYIDQETAECCHCGRTWRPYDLGLHCPRCNKGAGVSQLIFYEVKPK